MTENSRIYVSRRFDCSRSKLFDWLVQPELIAKWFGPEQLSIVNVTTNPHVGGTYSIEFKKSKNHRFFMEGMYLEIDAPKVLAYTLEYIGLPSSPPKSAVFIEIEEVTGNASKLSLTQEFQFIPSDMDSRTKAWEYMFAVLETELTTSSI